MDEMSPEEKAIAEADAKSGASLKLTILNPFGRIWTMVAVVELVWFMLIL